MSFSMSGGAFSHNRFDQFEAALKGLKEEKHCDGDCKKDCEECDEKKSAKKGKKSSGAKPDFLDVDKDGDKEESMKDAIEDNGGAVSEGMQHREADTGKVVDKAEVGKIYYPHGERQKSSVAKRKEAARAKSMKEAYAEMYAQKDAEQVEEGIDFKGAKRIDDARAKEQAEKDKKNPSGKDRRLALRKFRPGASAEERAEGGRDSMREKGTSPIKNGKKMFEEIQAAGLFTAEELEHLEEVLGLGKN